MKFERLEQIETFLRENGSVTVNELAKHFSVSKETIRNDLDYLASKKKIGRTHGGAFSFEYNPAVPYVARNEMMNDEKNRIATYVAGLIKDGSSIFVDTATTSGRVLKELIKQKKRLTVITNSLECIRNSIPYNNIDAYLIGGKLSRNNLSFNTAHLDDYKRFSADYAIISPTGVDQNLGITDNDERQAIALQIYIKNARQTYLVVDHSKLDSIAPFYVAGLHDIDGIVTDKTINRVTWSEKANSNKFFFKEVSPKTKVS